MALVPTANVMAVKNRIKQRDVVFIETSLNRVNQSVVSNISRIRKRHHGVYPMMAFVNAFKNLV
jgi:hypothetical protein